MLKRIASLYAPNITTDAIIRVKIGKNKYEATIIANDNKIIPTYVIYVLPVFLIATICSIKVPIINFSLYFLKKPHIRI